MKYERRIRFSKKGPGLLIEEGEPAIARAKRGMRTRALKGRDTGRADQLLRKFSFDKEEARG